MSQGNTQESSRIASVLSMPPGSLLHQARLRTWIDPEWLFFEGVLLLPSVLCLMVADRERAVFFAKLALHLGCLKWLGWLLVTRPSSRRESGYLLFPAELLVGLTVVVAWFYIRN